MKASQVILVCALFTVALSRLSIGSTECNNYLKKFGTANAANGVGPTSLAYTGDAAFTTGTANVQVNLRYSDSLYNDATYWGLTQEDGKTLDSTCLDLKLYKFTSATYADPVQVTDLPFTATSNLQKKLRYLSFTINGSDLATRLVQTSNSNQYLYTGYYAVAYYAAGTTQVQYTYYFQFSVAVNRNTNQAISTVFKPLSQFETVGCSTTGQCVTTAVSKIQWCTDKTCTTNTVPALYLNDQFYIQQVVTTAGLTNYYLTNTTVYYVGDGLNKVTVPVSVDNSVPGKTLLLLTADIAWSNVAIQVTSYISTTTSGARRFLAETAVTYDPVSASTEAQTCIKLASTDSTCATCEQQCTANKGIAGSSCPVCPESSNQILAVALSLLLLFVF